MKPMISDIIGFSSQAYDIIKAYWKVPRPELDDILGDLGHTVTVI